MRRVLFSALFAIAIVAPSHAQEALPRFSGKALYPQVRSDLKYAGWQPSKQNLNEKHCTIGREDVCEKYPEARDCAGNGMGACEFVWRKGLVYIVIRTNGDDIDGLYFREAKCEFGCN